MDTKINIKSSLQGIKLKDNYMRLEKMREASNTNNKIEWIKVSELTPPENVIIETKIDNEDGCRNIQKLIYKYNLWFLSDKNIHVYYTLTHWRYIVS